jgi:hypothetical protein
LFWAKTKLTQARRFQLYMSQSRDIALQFKRTQISTSVNILLDILTFIRSRGLPGHVSILVQYPCFLPP